MVPDDGSAPDPELPGELTCGVRVVAPVDDAGVLVALITAAFGEDDALFVGLAVGLADGVAEGVADGVAEADEEAEEDAEEEAEEAADTAPCVGVWLVQLGCGVGVLLGGAAGLGSLPGLSLADDAPVVGLGLGLPLTDGVPVVGLGLGLLLAPALELAVLPLLWLPPDDVAGGVFV